MSAFVMYEFKKGFLLDEERIRKVSDILNRRMKDIQGAPQPVYTIYRTDSFSYTTLNVQDVISEENNEWQKIVKLIISVRFEDSLNFELDFDMSGTKLHIEGENRDFVFLLFSDLKQYLSNEVNVRPRFSMMVRALLLSFSLVTASVGVMISVVEIWGKRELLSTEYIETLLKSQNIHEKLNFLVKLRLLSDRWFPLSMILLLIGLFPALLVAFGEEELSKIIGFIFPRNVFLFGREKDRYAKRQAMLSRILWSVVIALVISIAAGIVVWLITNR